MSLGSFILFCIFLYFLYLWIIILGVDDADYSRHRELILHPENDILGDTTTGLSMGADGKLKIKKRASIGATKRLLNKAWS